MFNEQDQYIPLLEPADYTTQDPDSDSVNMGKLNGIEILIQHGALTGDAATFRFYAGATAGTKTTELFPKYRVTGADIGNPSADVFGARSVTPAGGILITPATSFDHRVIVAELPSSLMPDGLNWLTIACAHGSASARNLAIIADGTTRYEGDTVTTAL
jgi:hypothetical protein